MGGKNNKSVLIVAYYWPPAGGPGVQRVLKFAKYLPHYGWRPLILTVENGAFPAMDQSLAQEIPSCCRVVRTKALEPIKSYIKFTGARDDQPLPTALVAQKPTDWKKRLARWIRLNLFIPDAKIGWIPHAVPAGKTLIREEKPDIIFSSAPPPTVQLIAKRLRAISGLPWVADFRDPWTDIYHYDQSAKSRLAAKLDHYLERRTLESADHIVTVSRHFARLFEEKSTRIKAMDVLTNGYDEEDFPNEPVPYDQNKFIIAYAGKFNHQQNPKNLWRVLKGLVRKDASFADDLRILLIGQMDAYILQELEEADLKPYVETPGYLDHKEALRRLQGAAILLLLVPDTRKNKGIIPGKVFEYLALRRSIFVFGPEEGDAARIVNGFNMGQNFTFDSGQPLEKAVMQAYENWKAGAYPQVKSERIEEYSRRRLTQKLVDIFESHL